MTGPNDTLDDETYESLIEELGLDLDIDDPIGDVDSESAVSSETTFSNEIPESQSEPNWAKNETEDLGVELSADLLAELQSVIGGNSDTAGSFDEEATFAEDQIGTETENSEADLTSALLGDVAAELNAVSGTKVSVGEPAVVSDDETDFGATGIQENEDSVFEGLDLSEDFEASDSKTSEDFSIEIEEFEEDDELEVEEISATGDLDSILEDALSRDFEPPVDDGQFADRFQEKEELLESPVEEEAVVAFDAEDVIAQDDEIDAGFSLDDFADSVGDYEDEEVDVSAPVSLGASTARQKETYEEEYVAAAPETIGEADSDDEIDFAMSKIQGGDRVIPRITMHAFCQTQTCQQMLNTSLQDRRMVNVAAEVVEGGVLAAINFYQENELPHLIVVESVAKSARLLAELDELAQMCDENVKVVVIGAANDIRLYRELMSRGVSEYIVPPLETVQLIRAISSQFADPEQPFVGKSIAVTGVKGGVGASTIAHNLAWTLAERLNVGTTLVDLDLNFGTAGLDFNNESNQTIADALLAPDRFDETVMSRLLTQSTENLSLFTAPASLDRTYDLSEETYEAVLSKVRESVPFVVLDLPHIWTDWFKGTVISADEIIVVTQPDLASLRNGKNLIDFLKAARPNDAMPKLVINQVGVPKRPEIPVKDFAQAMELEPDLVLPFDPQLFGTAANNGQMIAELSEESKCAQGIDYIASLVSGREMKTERSSLLTKLFKR